MTAPALPAAPRPPARPAPPRALDNTCTCTGPAYNNNCGCSCRGCLGTSGCWASAGDRYLCAACS